MFCVQRGANVALLATSWNPNPSLPGTIGEAWERCRAVRHDEDCVIGVRCDITNGGEVDYALNQITKKWGRIVSFFQLSYVLYGQLVFYFSGCRDKQRFDALA